MVSRLTIKNFKSIKNLDLDCRRVHLFIGEPNTGKSNILESLGLLSSIAHGYIRLFIRFEKMSNLFFDQDLENQINIGFDEKTLNIKFKDGSFVGNYFDGKTQQDVFNLNYDASGSQTYVPYLSQFKFYRFSVRRDFPNTKSEYLYPPNGDNLSTIIITNKELRRLVSQIFTKFNYRIVIEQPEGRIRMQKGLEYIVLSFPYFVISETLQRLVFYLSAIYSNKGSVLAFEEPESHAFPYYTKYLAERIALDQNKNQYFISTHNPYFLKSIIEKMPKDDVSILATYLENYQTKVKSLSESVIDEILELESDALFNIERFLTQ